MTRLSERLEAAQAAAAEARNAVRDEIGLEVAQLSTQLRDARIASGLVQQDISDAVGVTRSQVANAELGRGMSLQLAVGFAAALNMRLTLVPEP